MLKLKQANIKIKKLIRNEQNSQDFSKKIQNIVSDLKKDLLKLQVELSKKRKQLNQYDKVMRLTKP